MYTSEIKKTIEKIEKIPTLPVVLKRILEVTNDPSSSPEKLYEIISHDQALAERILRVANSPFFGHSGMIGDIRQSIMLLGYSYIRDIAVSIGVITLFSKRGDINLKNFWAHCYEVAFIAASMAETATMVSASTAFIAGLLHDCGRVLFYNLFRDRYKTIYGTDDLLEKENTLFGCDHAVAGSWFAEKTKLPYEQVLAIRYHHSPSATIEYRDLVSVVSLSEALSRRFSPKIEDDGIWTEEHDSLLLELSLTNEDLDNIEKRLNEEEIEIRGFLELI